ncbi:hypothetical protein [Spiroplasma ixodetis]|uniref:Transposase n=1 Tax=Spiroplasma ixodetis TaxID=2141 RepID=A0ABN6T341_9MOLU|nr:hypothetical protein [Spiroplasma ixodetis]BDT04769.1 hypothetical protein SHM_24150 [Spiroplasma ixodetis]
MDNFYAYIPLILKYIVILPYFLKDSKQVLTKKWTLPIQNWNTAIAHFMIKFEDRINLN